MTHLVNLTPHPIRIQRQDGEVITVPPSGHVARVASKTEITGTVAGISTSKTTYGEVEGLPDLDPNGVYIVSSMVLDRCTGPQFCAPDTGSTAVRLPNGHIDYVTALRFA